jgi:hypothetical protein
VLTASSRGQPSRRIHGFDELGMWTMDMAYVDECAILEHPLHHCIVMRPEAQRLCHDK